MKNAASAAAVNPREPKSLRTILAHCVETAEQIELDFGVETTLILV